MSTTYDDISYDIVDGVYDVLTGHITYSGTTYPVYKSIPKTPGTTYVYVGNVVQAEDGSKDSFIYDGTVQVHVVDESKERADKKLAQALLNITRQHLKPLRSTVFTIGSHTLVLLKPESFNELITQNDNGISKIRLVDMYNFLIQ